MDAIFQLSGEMLKKYFSSSQKLRAIFQSVFEVNILSFQVHWCLIDLIDLIESGVNKKLFRTPILGGGLTRQKSTFWWFPGEFYCHSNI